MVVGTEARVRVEAPRGAGVERAVGDDLVGADGTRPSGARHKVAGAQALGDRTVEVLRVDAERDAKRADAAGGAPHPVVAIPAHLEVGHAHDAALRGTSSGVGDPPVEHVVGHIVELAHEAEAVSSRSTPASRRLAHAVGAAAARFSQQACRSAATSTTGTSPETASSSARVGASGQSPSR